MYAPTHPTRAGRERQFDLIRLVIELDGAASALRRSRAEVIRLAIEYYLDDFEDLRASISAPRDPGDPVLDWEAVRDELLDQD